MQVKLFDEACGAVELFIGLDAIYEHRAAHDADLPPSKNIEHCTGAISTLSAFGEATRYSRVDFPAPLAPIRAHTRPGLM